jgi:hypothetical protein
MVKAGWREVKVFRPEEGRKNGCVRPKYTLKSEEFLNVKFGGGHCVKVRK